MYSIYNINVYKRIVLYKSIENILCINMTYQYFSIRETCHSCAKRVSYFYEILQEFISHFNQFPMKKLIFPGVIKFVILFKYIFEDSYDITFLYMFTNYY